MTSMSVSEVSEVVVPLDGSAFAARALGPATQLAARLQAVVHPVTVVPPDAEKPDVDVADLEVLVGTDAGDVIGAYAARSPGSVICMATHGRGWPASEFIGSAASLVIARSDRPLVLVGPDVDPDWRLEGGAVVAAADGQPGCERMLPVAARWASMLGLALTVVTVAEPAPAPLRTDRPSGWHGPGADPEAYVDKLVANLSGYGGPVNGRVIWDPIGAASGLRTFFGDDPADHYRPRGLVAISNHGRGPRPEVPLGRTALHIVHESLVPCLVVPVPLAAS